jgi:hypothetical protein
MSHNAEKRSRGTFAQNPSFPLKSTQSFETDKHTTSSTATFASSVQCTTSCPATTYPAASTASGGQ